MLKKLIILMSVFCFTHVFAADVLLKIGANNSWFANEGGTSETKPAAGIGVHFPLDESQVIKFGVDVLYVGQKMILKNKSWPANTLIEECGATFGDLYLHYHYLKFPIYLTCIIHKKWFQRKMQNFCPAFG